MSLVFLKRIVFGSHSEPSRSRETARSYRLYKKDLEIGTATTHSSSSSSSSQHDEPLLSKSEGIFDPDPRPPTRSSTRIISDATIGLSDGLTVPFALSAGLSALGNTKVVIYAGIAELIAGAISMGLGGYLAARSEA
ncbi:MAG: hypothetical protein FRX48_09298 [Lasallia pustulata]|uniref:Uncharacterized protein n=1 Tax=Lasallia pustulata TaxID=136370 RepID=A0A5M8PDM7_9LECA|nr:MAG: hypothetical protein FRX48_09298 [Lasallia pustulata]